MEEKTEQIAIFLEKHSYAEIKKYLNELSKGNPIEYMLFLTLVYNHEVLAGIGRHKVRLSTILESACQAEVLPEDRSRLILLFAELGNLDLDKANQTISQEFGPNLKIMETYRLAGKQYDWKFLSGKAKEVKQGLYNYCYLSVQDTVNRVIGYYKIFQINDLEKLKIIGEAAKTILSFFRNNPFILPASPQADQIIELLTKFYTLTNRLKLDIQKIKDEVDFSKEEEYVLTVHYICKTKLGLAAKKLPLDNIAPAEQLLLQDLGKVKFFDLLDSVEVNRFGVILPLKKQ